MLNNLYTLASVTAQRLSSSNIPKPEEHASQLKSQISVSPPTAYQVFAQKMQALKQRSGAQSPQVKSNAHGDTFTPFINNHQG